MARNLIWVALVTFERRGSGNDILPDWAHGACGWMLARARNLRAARNLLVRDLEHHDLRVLEIANEREARSDDEIEQIDEHLAANLRNIEVGKETVWGTLHCYKGEGEA